MDVVSDGSDGDRWPELDDYITMSQYYQPFTSYGWGKRTSNPNPLLARWKENLKKYEEEFAIEGLSIERNRFLRQQIETLGPEIADMEARSYLIAEADPFFVLPLSFLGRRDENEFGPAIGDYGVIIYENQIFPVIAGDAGPSWKFGEASLRVAETKGPPDLEAWHAKCSELLNGVGGISENYQLHQWEDLIAKKKAEREAKKAAKEKAAESEAEEDAPNSQPQPGQ
jgi:hypothetical protein